MQSDALRRNQTHSDAIRCNQTHLHHARRRGAAAGARAAAHDAAAAHAAAATSSCDAGCGRLPLSPEIEISALDGHVSDWDYS